jgi:hypothetical protein
VWWIRFPVNAVECMWNWVRRRAEFGMQPLNVTRETGLPPKLIGEDPRAGVQIYRISDCIPVKQVFLTKPRPLLTVKLLTANSIGKALNLL